MGLPALYTVHDLTTPVQTQTVSDKTKDGIVDKLEQAGYEVDKNNDVHPAAKNGQIHNRSHEKHSESDDHDKPATYSSKGKGREETYEHNHNDKHKHEKEDSAEEHEHRGKHVCRRMTVSS